MIALTYSGEAKQALMDAVGDLRGYIVKVTMTSGEEFDFKVIGPTIDTPHGIPHILGNRWSDDTRRIYGTEEALSVVEVESVYVY